MRRLLLLLLSGQVLLVLAGCDGGSSSARTEARAGESITNYSVRGTVQSLQSDGKTVVIRHEAVSNYMDAMTMPFQVKDPAELRGLTNGSAVTFRLRVTENAGWIDQVRVVPVETASTNPIPKDAAVPSDVRVVPAVPLLGAGDALPNYALTNQLGVGYDLKGFRGQVLVLDFIFTRCPFPDFCPFLSRHFATLQQHLKENGPDGVKCHLITVTIDPKYDTQERLQAYGRMYNTDPAIWSLSTASTDTLERLAGHFELYFARDVEPAQQNHNLRTVVIDPKGRVSRVFKGNRWTDEELLSAVEAAGKL